MSKKRQGSKNEAVRKIGKVGRYSYCITIPKTIVQDLGWRERQKVVVSRDGRSLTIRDWKPPKRKG